MPTAAVWYVTMKTLAPGAVPCWNSAMRLCRAVGAVLLLNWKIFTYSEKVPAVRRKTRRDTKSIVTSAHRGGAAVGFRVVECAAGLSCLADGLDQPTLHIVVPIYRGVLFIEA